VPHFNYTHNVGVAHDAAIEGPEGEENSPHDHSILIHVQIHRRDTFFLKHVNGYVIKTHVLNLDFTVALSINCVFGCALAASADYRQPWSNLTLYFLSTHKLFEEIQVTTDWYLCAVLVLILASRDPANGRSLGIHHMVSISAF
jgi:hypothetical protein